MNGTAQKIIIAGAAVVLIGLFLGGFFFGVAVYGWRAAQRAGNEAATIQNLKTVAQVEIWYFNTHNRAFATFDQLVREEMLSKKFEGNPPIVDGYVFTLSLSKNVGAVTAYTLTADPVNGAGSGRHFYIDSVDNQVHVDSDSAAGPRDPVVNN